MADGKFANVVKAGGIYLLGGMVERGATVVLLPFIAAFIPADQYGRWALLVITGQLAVMITVNPLVAALRRYFYEPNFVPHRRQLLGALMIFALPQAVAITGAMALLAEPVGRSLMNGGEWVPLIQWYALVVLLGPLAQLPVTVLQLEQRAARYAAIRAVASIVSTTTGVLLLAVFDLGLWALLWAALLNRATLTTLALPSYVNRARWRTRLSMLREPLAYGYPQLVSGYARRITEAGDRYVLAIFVPFQAVGAYNLAYMLVSAASMLIVEPANLATSPAILAMEKDPHAQRRFIRRIATAYFALSAFLALGLAVFAEEILTLVAADPSFHSGWIVMPVIALAYVQHGLGGMLNWGLVMRKRSLLITRNLLIAAGANLLLNFALVPIIGIMGAAVATVAAYALWNAQRAWYSWRLYQLAFDWGRIGVMTVLAILLGCLGLFLGGHFQGATSILIKSAALAAFALITWFGGILRREERQALIRLAHSARRRSQRDPEDEFTL